MTNYEKVEIAAKIGTVLSRCQEAIAYWDIKKFDEQLEFLRKLRENLEV